MPRFTSETPSPEQPPLPIEGIDVPVESTPEPFDSRAFAAAVKEAGPLIGDVVPGKDSTDRWLEERGDPTRDYTRLQNPPKPPAEQPTPPAELSERAKHAQGAEDYIRARKESGREDDIDLHGIPPVR